MSAQLEQKVLEILKTIKDPANGNDIVSAGMVVGLQSKDGHIAFTIDIGDPKGPRILNLFAKPPNKRFMPLTVFSV